MAASVGRRQLRTTVPLLLSAIAVATRTSALTADWQRDATTAFLHQQPGHSNHACYRTVQNPYVYFGSKTTYGVVAGNDLQTPADCRPMQVWMVARHGTRYPSREMIESLMKLHDFKTMITAESLLCPEDISAIRNWKFNLTSSFHYMLHRQGIEELKSLAIRLKRQLPQIFNNTTFDENKFKFLTSHKKRAQDSATAFYQSMFNQNPEKDLPIVQTSDDRFYLYKCKQIGGEDDDKSDNKVQEVKKFEDGPYMRSVVSRVSMVMGLKQNLSYENVSLLWEACKYDKAWFIQTRPAWCSVFTQADLEILEYAEDLKYYYSNGYGNPIGETMGCPIVKDMMDNFRNLSVGTAGPSGVFYFGHTPNILSVVTRLGVGEDSTPLLSTNFEQMKNRKWRTSYIDPFASNIIAVFYKCKSSYKAMILLNEHALPMGKDQCRLCPWESIEAQYNPITSYNMSCNLNICNNSASFTSISLGIIIFTYTCSILGKYIFIFN